MCCLVGYTGISAMFTTPRDVYLYGDHVHARISLLDFSDFSNCFISRGKFEIDAK